VLWATGRLAVPAARAALERPALFGAAVLQDGAYDLVRTLELLPDGRTDPEFGALAPRAAVESTVDASPYHQVRDGIRYPGVLLVEGPNADGAPPWSATKFLARLQAASTRGRPLLLDARTAQDGPDDRRARLATAFAFALREARTGGTVD
jgi:prolyl oligopeptidase